MRYRGVSSSPHASTSCRAVQPAVGCSVTLKCTSRRRSWFSTTSTNRTRNVAVGTVKKSNAIRSLAWFFKNARHACDGGLRGRSIYLETVACDTARPSFSSSPWILGAPQRIGDRKSTRLNSSHGYISYAVFCLKKKNLDLLKHIHSARSIDDID